MKILVFQPELKTQISEYWNVNISCVVTCNEKSKENLLYKSVYGIWK